MAALAKEMMHALKCLRGSKSTGQDQSSPRAWICKGDMGSRLTVSTLSEIFLQPHPHCRNIQTLISTEILTNQLQPFNPAPALQPLSLPH